VLSSVGGILLELKKIGYATIAFSFADVPNIKTLDYVMSFIEKFLGNQLTNECY
jgi:hypothetical protein